MTYLKVATSNLKRNLSRSILTCLTLAISATTLCVVLTLNRGYKNAVTNELVKKTGVHMYITKEGCPIEAASVIAQGGLSPLYVAEEVVEKVKKVHNVDQVMPFKLFTLTTDDGTRTDIFMGVTKEIEHIKPNWKYEKGGWFTGSNSVILGGELARIEGLNIGEKLYSEHFDKEFVISGILPRTYSQDDGTFFIPLKTAQKLISRENKLSAIAIKLKDINLLASTQNQIRAQLPSDYYVIGSKELSKGILDFFSSTRMVLYTMAFVAVLIAMFSIINTMLMTVLERKKEIAYMKCIGAGSTDLIKLISLESLAICFVGSIIGTLGGALVSPLFGSIIRKYLMAFTPTNNIATPNLLIMVISFGVCLLLGVTCSLYPAYRASKVVPMEVLSHE